MRTLRPRSLPSRARLCPLPRIRRQSLSSNNYKQCCRPSKRIDLQLWLKRSLRYPSPRLHHRPRTANPTGLLSLRKTCKACVMLPKRAKSTWRSSSRHCSLPNRTSSGRTRSSSPRTSVSVKSASASSCLLRPLATLQTVNNSLTRCLTSKSSCRPHSA